MKKLTTIAAAIALTACATGTEVTEIGPNTYMVGGLGGFFDYSASQVKVKYFKEATQYCANKGMTMVPLNSSGRDSAYATYASAEVQFKCVPNK